MESYYGIVLRINAVWFHSAVVSSSGAKDLVLFIILVPASQITTRRNRAPVISVTESALCGSYKETPQNISLEDLLPEMNAECYMVGFEGNHVNLRHPGERERKSGNH